MVSFANVADLEARWRTLSVEENGIADIQLEMASRMLRALAPTIDQRIDDDLLDADLVIDVVTSMVRRRMSASTDAEGVSSTQQQAGPFGQTLSFAYPSGGLYVTKAEKKMLGIGVKRAFEIDTDPTDTSVGYWSSPDNWNVNP